MVKRERLAGLTVVAAGAILAACGLLGIRDAARHMVDVDSLVTGFIGVATVCLGIVLVLTPLRRFMVVAFIIRCATWPVFVFVHYFLFVSVVFLTLMVTVALPLTTGHVLKDIEVVPSSAEDAVVYVAWVVALLVFTYWGRRMTEWLLRRLGGGQDFSKLSDLLRPVLVRVYIYGILATIYVAVNVEGFSGKIYTSEHWWLNTKSVVLEVLLTYIVIDRIVVYLKGVRSSESRPR